VIGKFDAAKDDDVREIDLIIKTKCRTENKTDPKKSSVRTGDV